MFPLQQTPHSNELPECNVRARARPRGAKYRALLRPPAAPHPEARPRGPWSLDAAAGGAGFWLLKADAVCKRARLPPRVRAAGHRVRAERQPRLGADAVLCRLLGSASAKVSPTQHGCPPLQVLDFVENEFRDAHRDAPGQVPGDVRVLSAMINRGYAQTFGYCHVWAKCTATDRHPAWCKVKAVEWAAKRYSSSDVIYLESDAYVRTQRPVDLTQLREHGAVAAFTLSCEWFPFVHNTLGYVEEVSIEKHRSIFHNGDYLGALKTANGTRAADPKNPVDTPEALATSVFVIMGGDEGGLKLLERWWAAAPEAKGERMSRASEPAALNAVLAADTEARLRVDVLDYPTYNGADGEFIRHMSGGRGLDPVFKHDIADTLLRHADKTTLYFTELFGDLFKVDVSV